MAGGADSADSADGTADAHPTGVVGEAQSSDSAGPLDFDGILRHLRRLAAPCEPPVGVGSFELLYANEREIVVWYSPARDYQQPGEVAISCVRLAAAWAALAAGEPLDEAALVAHGGSIGAGRWLLALLAQLPGICIREEPLTLVWDSPSTKVAPAAAPVPASAAVPIAVEVPIPAAGVTTTTGDASVPATPPTTRRRARARHVQP